MSFVTGISKTTIQISDYVFMKHKETVSITPAQRYIAHATFKNRLHAIASRRLIAHALADNTILPFAEICWDKAMWMKHSWIKRNVVSDRALKRMEDELRNDIYSSTTNIAQHHPTKSKNKHLKCLGTVLGKRYIYHTLTEH